MTDRILSLRQLNRTHLHRQHLLERSPMSTVDMLRAIVGLQAQVVKDPYLALWSRILDFQHEDLATMLEDRSAVRASLMRGTIHLVTADDYQMIFPATFTLHQRAVHNITEAKLVPAEHHVAIVQQAREMLNTGSYTAAEIGAALHETWPDFEPRSLSQLVRFLLPLIQTPPRGVWGAKNASRPSWAHPEGWLGIEVPEVAGEPHEMIRRYLRAFGPASLPDITAWSGVTNLKKPLIDLGDELVTHKNEDGVVLYDLATEELIPEDVDPPVRFLPGFDNALLGHKDRRRIIGDEARRAITTLNGLFSSTFLVDGFVAGTWRVKDGSIELASFGMLTKQQVRDVESEAAKMSPFWSGEYLPQRWVEPWKA